MPRHDRDDQNQTNRLLGKGAEPVSLLPPADWTADRLAAPDPGTAGATADDFREALLKAEDPVEEILLKPVETWTEAEVRRVMARRHAMPGQDAERERLWQREKAWFESAYGTDPAEFDEFGRMMQPRPKRPIPQTETPPRTPSGEPLDAGLLRLGRKVAETEGDATSPTPAVRRLQAAANLIDRAEAETAVRQGQRPASAPPLAEDGDPGPKTRRALHRQVARYGPGKLQEAAAMARFRDYLDQGGSDYADLDAELGRSFGPLFRGATAPTAGPEEARALQAALNDLGRGAEGPRGWQPLAEDGRVGPRTREAFARLVPGTERERVLENLAHHLGFL